MPLAGVPAESSPGLWSVSVFPGHADELLSALDPAFPFVLIECGDPSRGWHDALVTIGPESTLSTRLVRNVSFDVLVAPSEAAGLGPLLRAEHDGQLRAVQLMREGDSTRVPPQRPGLEFHEQRREPSAHFRLPAADHGLAQAMNGLGVQLTIDLPHDGAVANLRSTQESVLHAFVERL